MNKCFQNRSESQEPQAPGSPPSDLLKGDGRGAGGGTVTDPPALPQNLSFAPSCVRCGACLAVCPLYRLVRRESVAARGKLNLWDAVREGVLPAGTGLKEALQCCLLCGACAEKCAVGLNVPEMIKEFRAGLHREQGGLWNPALLLARLSLKAPQLLGHLAPAASLLQRLQGWVGAESGLIYRIWPQLAANVARLPRLARRPFRVQAPARIAGRGPLKIAFFAGCGLEAFFPQAGLAFLAICQQREIEVIIPPRQGCCGLLAEGVGDRDTARALARRVLEDFPPTVDFVVTACASCSYQLKRLGRVLKETPEAEAAARLAAKVREASEFLVHDVGYRPQGRRQGPGHLAFHDPCHLHRGQGIIREPRELLAAAGVEVVEPQERQCCGLGGAFGALYPELSQRLAADRRRDFREQGAQGLVTSCSGCLIQFAHGLKARHLLEVIAPGNLF
jgi:glycolate oxidase iron-sulfur subunit